MIEEQPPSPSILPNGACGEPSHVGLGHRCARAAGKRKGWSNPVTHEKTCRSWRRIIPAALMSLFLTSAGSIAQTSSTTGFSGRAYVVQATVPPLSPITPITVADTGPLPSTGGAEEASLLDVPAISLGSAGALNGADVAHATTIGRGNASRSEASVADLSLTAAGNTVAADFLMSEVTAQCNGASPSVSGRSELARLVINGQAIVVSGATNQTILLPLNAGAVVINEQSSSVNGQSGTMDVNALHVMVNDPTTGATLADVIISHAHADVTCPLSPPPCDATAGDFVTGGGWIVSPSDPNAKANFAVAGGIKNGSFWGHFIYLDHGKPLRAKGTAVNGYDTYPDFGATGRRTSGYYADVDGTPEPYEADVADNGEPGRGVDKFRLLLNRATVTTPTDESLAGGNIQLHKQQCQ